MDSLRTIHFVLFLKKWDTQSGCNDKVFKKKADYVPTQSAFF